ncbi:MAG: ABC transporter permease [Saprospiraceae bacterium]|jgi:putative ABC transport system permease protein|nr:ABC transporter permease [Saprospiraceae bacterium]MBK7437342.1 ABC transporter permease [Saprospiraceae bacterium]MBK8512625.1 ABC transporter permease [Saprospiraceae bacterium]MBK8776233.1 ABC transporter permease [Saprospiraceae bacterium]MBK9678476.1 ABC transporter permease [Saprospiraceae bacterium]
MIKNYFKIALRNLWKFKGFSLINIFGLSMGLACFVLIAMYVADELSYDRYNEKVDRIFRINSDIRFGGTDLNMAVSADPMGAVLKKDYPQVEEYARLYSSSGSRLIKKGDEYINEDRITYADSTFLKVFTMPVLAGDSKNFLNEPNTVAITETIARKYFGDVQGAIGKTIETSGANPTLFKVTTVLADMPHNSHFIYDFLFSMANVDYDFGNFLSHNFHTYVLLKPGTDYQLFNKNFDQVINKYILPQAKQYMQIESMEDFAKSGNMLKYSLFPIKDIHLHSSRTVELGVNGNIQYVYIFSAVALFILLIACINFMNLSTARSAGRAKEVGIRKVLGTEKKALIGQFLTESTLMAFISTLLAISIIWISMPWFNTMAGKQLEFTILFKPQYILFLFSLPIVIGILAGSYPAFYLSAFQPISVLKGKLNAGSKKNGLRNFLVVFQFATSIILIIGTIIVYQQLKFIQNTNLGFNKDQVLVVNNPGIRGENREVFKNEIAKLSGIKSASFAGYLPVSNSSRNDNTFSPDAVMNEKNGFNMQSWSVDYDYIPTLGMEIIKGRNFSKEYGSDSAAIIINESTAAVLGPDEPIGKYLYTNDGGSPNSTTALQIIGVVKNFHYESLRKNVGPLSMRLGNNRWASAYRVDTKDINQLVKNIELKYKEMAPGMPFSYQFLDDSFDEMYREDQRIGQVSLNFAFLAILIACMGLLGLATYTMEQRTKEIGVRKVLGATVANIVKMLSKDFLMLVSISIVIAVPIAWFGMYKWLQEFAFRMDMSIWIFVAAGVVALLIAFITVSFQAIKAALMNPIKSLRTE